ncbi:hypothetical protein J7I01_004323 [Vibrio parahaemolyticus]|nr:hypothetical protein [Vibrio parahaemolyticus]
MNKIYDKRYHYQNAKELLEKEDECSLRYACLEMRYLIEAHVYERLLHGIDDLPKSVINTWQPNKAMKMLLAFDDLADKDIVVKILDPDSGEQAEIRYNNIPVKELNKLYNSLGSYLHLPTPKKSRNSNFKKTKVLGFFEKLSRVVDTELIIKSVDYRHFHCAECNKPILYTEYYVRNNSSIKCQNEACDIEYGIRMDGNKGSFDSSYIFKCCICSKPVSVYHSHISDGFEFSCNDCNTNYSFELEIRCHAEAET